MKRPEILAPVGTKEAFIAAINAGANAVFLAGQKFGARAYLANFSIEEIKEMVLYAHLRDVLLFVTINTLTFDNEIESLLTFTDELVRCNVDALIVQDLGLIGLLTKRYPNTEIHASTQVNAHNIHHVKFLKELGVKRVILARETSIETIKKIKEEVDIDIEVFIHGALCVSFSGNCLFSSMINKRSGNRGECAQSCRLNYQLIKDKTPISDEAYLLSTKDLMTLDYLNELIDAGVDSLKIEGRMRKYTYVTQVVLSYKHAIEAHMNHKQLAFEQEVDRLKRVFNREFTKGYMFHEIPKDINNDFRPNHMGVLIGKVIDYKEKRVYVRLTESFQVGDGYRLIGDKDYGNVLFNLKIGQTSIEKAKPNDVVNFEVKEEIAVGSDCYKTTDSNLENELDVYLDENYSLIPLSIEVSAFVGMPLIIKVKDNRHNEVYKIGTQVLEEAKKNVMTAEEVKNEVNRFGRSPFFIDSFEFITDNQTFVPIKVLNDLRRDAIIELTELRLNQPGKEIVSDEMSSGFKDVDQAHLVVKVHTLDQLEAAYALGITEIYYDDVLEVNENNYPKATLFKVLKRIIEDNQDYKDDPKVVLNEIGSLGNKQTTKEMIGDEFLNVTNIHTANLVSTYGIKRVTLSSELSYERLKHFTTSYERVYKREPNLELIVYGYKDLMISKYCPVAKNFGYKPNCKLCFKNQYYLQDRQHGKFAMINDGNCNMRIMDSKPLVLLSYLPDILACGINTLRLDFTLESKKETQDIIKAYQLKFQGIESVLTINKISTGRFLG
ncbi:Peptidase, U32 family protein [Paracholeplasma brassicae]|uniref:Peptidase, U32 family protein n=1 Tax=Acholeplasma brassicae TaxID=61635 RepID=U4KR64_9MOLU|nr:U32 family peptidase [Paracholeplasma brassicae]CCV65458.1 Peptidase, U32 family protein [Paracholeplasma brassicae]